MPKEIFPAGTIIHTPFFDPDIVMPDTNGWKLKYTQMEKEKISMSIYAFHTPHIQFSTAFHKISFLLQGEFPKDTVILSYIHSRSVRNFQNKKVEQYELIVTTSKNEIDLLSMGSSQIFTVTIEENYFYETFRNYFGLAFEDLAQQIRFKLIPDKVERFKEDMNAWIRFFLQNDTIEFAPHEYTHIENEIMHSLFCFIDMKERKERISESTLNKARTFIHEHITSNFLIDDLARELNTNTRNLQRLFKNHAGLSPKSYLQNLRLNEARKEFLAADRKNVSVQDIARKYGFFHMGHFTSEYKRLFGETPSQTLSQYRFT